jgi:transcriptional regulator with XRE-family HTH domain
MKVLRAEREAKGISQSELGRRSGINQVTISAAENARFVPYSSQLERLAGALGWQGEPADLLNEAQA